MILEIALTLVGLYLILKGSEWVTDAAVPLAAFLNTTHVAIGLILVSLLLSLPELMVAMSAMAKGHADLGIGTVIGSIIVNLGLIIGISAMMRPLKIPRHLITRDAVFMLVITIVVSLLVLEDRTATRRDGIVLLLLLIPYVVNIYEQEKSLAMKERHRESEMISKTLQFTGKINGVDLVIHDSRLIFLGGLVMLLVGSELFTSSLISIAALAGVSELLIGLTIGALGPSISNLAAAVQAVRKGYDELAVSETIGSNILTLLMTLGIIAIVQPFNVDAITATITAPALLVVTATFFIFTMKGTISRPAGAVLVGMYLVAMALEILARTGHI
jgi:cation:H+ antiporter